MHYAIEDESGCASVVFWDRLAIQLVKKTASQLKFIENEVYILMVCYLFTSETLRKEYYLWVYIFLYAG